MEQLSTELAASVHLLQEELASVPANRRVEALTAAKHIVDTATRKVGSFRVGAGGGVDDTDPVFTRKPGMHTSVQRLRSCLESGGGGGSRGGVSLEALRRKAEVEDPVGVAPFVHMGGGIKAKSKESMGAQLTREAKESGSAGGGDGGDGGGGGDGDSNVAAASRGRAPGTCTRCKDNWQTGVGHTKASPNCPYAPANPVKRKAPKDPPAKAVKRKTKLTPQDTRFVDGNQFDINGN